ncbi:hypothetical protein CYMTET_25787 [Cymbomonas tetramitiformis]|uniref:Uncharacterized protein n=1 Tax=Cymbomonas tetramitiformis TaxID=36881 RepID=A0AAE0FT13_9CHLO|nr:hypothetical protein CYMTET_25787 [Cymbomonas tetramitiformis]
MVVEASGSDSLPNWTGMPSKDSKETRAMYAAMMGDFKTPKEQGERYETSGKSFDRLLHREWSHKVFSDRNPSNRGEVLHLIKWLYTKIQGIAHESDERQKAHAEVGDAREHDRYDYEFLAKRQEIFNHCVYEICRQSSVSCVERGRLLAYLWNNVDNTIRAILVETSILQQKFVEGEAIRVDLEKKLKTATMGLLKENAQLKEEIQALKDTTSDEKVELVEVKEELDALHKWKEAGVDKLLENQVMMNARQLRVLEMENVELLSANARLKAVSEKSQRSLDQTTMERDGYQNDAINARIRNKHNTPRLSRRYGVLRDMLDDQKIALFDNALAQRVDLNTLIEIVTDEQLVPYTAHMGILPETDELNSAKLQEILDHGDRSSLEKYMDAKTLLVLLNMLHHGLNTDKVVTMLMGRKRGQDISELGPLCGCLKGMKPESLMPVLKVAAMSNQERFRELQDKIKAQQSDITGLQGSVAQLESEKKAADDEEERKQAHREKNKVVTPLHKFLDIDWKDTFIGMGTAGDVPKFLKTNAKVRNRQMVKRDVEKLVKEIWAEKAMNDAKEKSVRPFCPRASLLHLPHRLLSMLPSTSSPTFCVHITTCVQLAYEPLLAFVL